MSDSANCPTKEVLEDLQANQPGSQHFPPALASSALPVVLASSPNHPEERLLILDEQGIS